jgi:hypothetical protein
MGAKLKLGAAPADSLPRLRGRVGEGDWPLAQCLPTGPLPNPPPQAGEGTGLRKRCLPSPNSTSAMGDPAPC